MAEVKKTWIKQGSVDSTYENNKKNASLHVYYTTKNLIDNTGIYAIVSTKDGSKWSKIKGQTTIENTF